MLVRIHQAGHQHAAFQVQALRTRRGRDQLRHLAEGGDAAIGADQHPLAFPRHRVRGAGDQRLCRHDPAHRRSP
ncbi:hypothetical protein HB662_04790 [Roseomonas frigidaquae]|uniref:Uncharacterized protein n=1 Tax=Falsiroseomonas frigidaquae TaxID=487318 RepID=A0ABX1ETY6_9PROT|nr:hypothetical protein [Falsiroseomonas frigidaquae]NKE44080.1 hypothetical protein [Falsiroseomonas frigidaquae]